MPLNAVGLTGSLFLASRITAPMPSPTLPCHIPEKRNGESAAFPTSNRTGIIEKETTAAIMYSAGGWPKNLNILYPPMNALEHNNLRIMNRLGAVSPAWNEVAAVWRTTCGAMSHRLARRSASVYREHFDFSIYFNEVCSTVFGKSKFYLGISEEVEFCERVSVTFRGGMDRKARVVDARSSMPLRRGAFPKFWPHGFLVATARERALFGLTYIASLALRLFALTTSLIFFGHHGVAVAGWAHRMRLAWRGCVVALERAWRHTAPCRGCRRPCGRMDVRPGCLAPCPVFRARVFAHTARPATGRMEAPTGVGLVRHRLWLAGNYTPAVARLGAGRGTDCLGLRGIAHLAVAQRGRGRGTDCLGLLGIAHLAVAQRSFQITCIRHPVQHPSRYARYRYR